MGRDKPKKYSKMGYFEKQEYHDKQAKKYNINKDDYISGHGGGGGRYDRLNDGAYEKAIKNAQRNDFDYRTSAQHMDGVKGNAKMGDFTEYERAAVKLHKQAGNGGQFSSNEDITTVTNNLVRDYRNSLKDSMSAKDQVDVARGNTDDEDVVLSDQLQQAEDAVKEFDNKNYDVYNQGKETSDGDDQRDQAANSFLDKFKMDLMSNMRPKLPI